MRSDAIEPGTLPHAIRSWEVPVNKAWEPHASAQFWLSESIAALWQEMRVKAFRAPVLSVRGVRDAFVDGLYDFIPSEGLPGDAPVFQHQQRPNLWLFLARDQRWWIGNTAAKDAKDDKGIVHSAVVQPGTHPSQANGWHVRSTKVWEECRDLKIQSLPRELRACEKWARARANARTVQVWGKAGYHGEYELTEGTCYLTSSFVPAYQCRSDPDVWLYVAEDGRWWLSDTASKDQREARGYMRSDVVEPGVLPQDLQSWRELKSSSWEVNPMMCVVLPESAAREWQLARDEVSQASVIEVQGVSGPSFNGMYDLIDAEDFQDEVPAFQNQINQDLFLYLATDGSWWVNNADAMMKRAASGRMHSDMVQPGMLPTASAIGWHVFNRTSKEWEKQDRVTIL